jgi:hypothetical protein
LVLQGIVGSCHPIPNSVHKRGMWWDQLRKLLWQ